MACSYGQKLSRLPRQHFDFSRVARSRLLIGVLNLQSEVSLQCTVVQPPSLSYMIPLSRYAMRSEIILMY